MITSIKVEYTFLITCFDFNQVICLYIVYVYINILYEYYTHTHAHPHIFGTL